VPVNIEIKACRDPKDDMYLELALSGKAECIITNDEDLLSLHPFENIPIITPKEYLKSF
jgi:predicted nucleic acid-binding protein